MRPDADQARSGAAVVFRGAIALGLPVLGLLVASASAAGGAKPKPTTVKPATGKPATVKPPVLAAGLDHSLVLTSGGAVYAWGWNMTGQLGNGNINGSDVPVKVRLPGRTKATAIGAGFAHSLAVTSTGAAFAWGKNYNGNLGNGSTTDSEGLVRVELPAGTKVATVAVGGEHNLAVTSTGALLAWGLNNYGQLGNGGTGNSGVPVDVTLPAGTTVTEVAAGAAHSLALTSTGAVLAWGYNIDGELGDGSKTNSDVPVKVKLPAGTKAIAIAANGEDSLALTSTGAVYAWGYNGDGELGDGNRTTSDVPVRVKLHTKVTAISTGGFLEEVGTNIPGPGHSLAVTSSGAVYAWGYNGNGELGNGKTTSSDVPVKVKLPGNVKVVAVAAGDAHSLAMTSTHAVLAWGANDFGQLGDGNYKQSDVPGAREGAVTVLETRGAVARRVLKTAMALADGGAAAGAGRAGVDGAGKRQHAERDARGAQLRQLHRRARKRERAHRRAEAPLQGDAVGGHCDRRRRRHPVRELVRAPAARLHVEGCGAVLPVARCERHRDEQSQGRRTGRRHRRVRGLPERLERHGLRHRPDARLHRNPQRLGQWHRRGHLGGRFSRCHRLDDICAAQLRHADLSRTPWSTDSRSRFPPQASRPTICTRAQPSRSRPRTPSGRRRRSRPSSSTPESAPAAHSFRPRAFREARVASARVSFLACAGGLIGPCRRGWAVRLEEAEELADVVAVLGGVAHRDVGIDAVAVATTDALAVHVAALDQIGDDALRGALRDANGLGDVAVARVRVATEAQKDTGCGSRGTSRPSCRQSLTYDIFSVYYESYCVSRVIRVPTGRIAWSLSRRL